ncbi:hypothetical protein SAMN02745883_02089 [Caminicella sporogenes DSM 14501]|uniref:Transporter n=1 Tax=Caminicella sporogenes DSM 14501 TaxID=1121266 RepID=A0A1M6SMD4_9FIRM|nr:hypothetical protein [Caminicella sporogenes]RKD26539.1 hypothetical protein BET04_10450 [Caminicella sporogenes]SHK45748.1 hypothetical protein SAMN02745883_02089 [Caminicella sporogenes DSM 14501]
MFYNDFYDQSDFLYRRPPRPPLVRPPFAAPGGSTEAPTSPPPPFTPERPVGVLAVDPGAIRPCKYRFVYLWLKDGREFWAYLVFVGRRSVAGFKWVGCRRWGRWVYFGTDIRNIEHFECY